jgi:hypothetical protein
VSGVGERVRRPAITIWFKGSIRHSHCFFPSIMFLHSLAGSHSYFGYDVNVNVNVLYSPFEKKRSSCFVQDHAILTKQMMM